MASGFPVGAFFTRCTLENPAARDKSAIVPRILVDTGSEYTWVRATILERLDIRREKKELSFIMANGQTITLAVGFAIIRLDKFFTIDEIVFAEKGDLSLLGARTLEGLNLTVDARRKKLIAAGPLPAASVRPAKDRAAIAKIRNSETSFTLVSVIWSRHCEGRLRRPSLMLD